eukprot:m.78440 g.78440  ORF g.78440 m.78440 type:complete len:148 (+) comp10711_c0_seq2:198-641(+)
MASEEFIPAAQFDGAKPGYMFQMGTKGLGYYVDKKQRKDQGDEAAGKSAGPKREVVGFANDGSFMEQFQKMQQEQKAKEAAARKAADAEASAKRKSAGGDRDAAKKRKGDAKTEGAQGSEAWQAYLEQVKMYEAQTCKEYQQGAIVK